MDKVQITQGNLLTGFGSENKKVANIADKLKDIFSVQVVSQPVEAEKEQRAPVKNITAKNLKHLESIDIKNNDWEKVSGSTKTTDVVSDLRAIKPSRSEKETDNGGRSTLSNSLNSIFNPTAIREVKNSEFTEHVISSGKEKRKAEKDKMLRPRDWENEVRAKTTADMNPAQMGFTPNRSSFEAPAIPKVDLPIVETIKANNKKSAESGKQAAEIITELTKVWNDAYVKDANDNRRWEDIQADKIAQAQVREINVQPSGIKLAPEVVKEKLEPAKIDLSGVFKMPENPAEAKEQSIKENLEHLKSQRKRREEDRSWEVPSKAKKTW